MYTGKSSKAPKPNEDPRGSFFGAGFRRPKPKAKTHGFMFNGSPRGSFFGATQSSSKDKTDNVDPPTLNEEEQAIVDMVNAYLACRTMSPRERKKRGRAILLKVHPDKCRMVNLDAHTLAQKVLKHMQQA
jgi:hypothetical protein